MTYSALIRLASTGTANSINNILTTSCRHRSLLLLSSITSRTTTTITTIRNYAPAKSRLCLFEANRRDSHLLANVNSSSRSSRSNTSIWRKAEPRRFQSSKADEKSSKSVPRDQQVSLLNWRSVAVVLIFGTAMLLFFWKLKYQREQEIKRRRKEAVGKMAIGGPFELVDQNGKLCKSSDFLGKWMLIYFGFTHCPDICPDELEKMVRAVDLIEKVGIKSQSIVPIFITVDPERDSVPIVAKYIKDFSPKLLGLTGDKKQVEQATRAYRVYFNQGQRDEDNDYIVDHTVIMYLVDPEGNFVDYYGQNKKAEEIATAVAIHMGSFEAANKNPKS